MRHILKHTHRDGRNAAPCVLYRNPYHGKGYGEERRLGHP